TSYATGTPPRGKPRTITSSRPAYFESFSTSIRPASARFGKIPSMQLRFAPNQFSQRNGFGNRLRRFKIIAKAGCKHSTTQRPPSFHARSMVVSSGVKIPTLPLFAIKRPLALLEPGILGKLKQREENGGGSQAIFFSGSPPIFDGRRKRPRYG